MNNKDLANLIFPDAKPIEFYEEKYPERDLPEGAMVVRIGPSPTGSVHIGTIYQALLARTIADKTNGVFFMRVEDTDQKREVENGIKDIIDSLKYFDVLPDEGMDTETTWHGEYGPYRQSMRKEIYQAYAKYLLEQGKAYPCFATAEELEEMRKTQEVAGVKPGYYGVWAKYRNLTVEEAAEKIKEITFTKFDASVDIDVRLGVDPRKANQMVRGVVTLPHGTGKTVRVLVLCTPEKEEEAKAAGADYVGLDEYVEKIKGGWTDVDVIITTPNVMGKVGALGRILGPRGLMPNPKTGTVTMDVAKAVSEVKAGKIDFKVDKFGIVHTSIGKVSFSPEQIVDNANEFLSMIMKLKPSAAKGSYVKSIYLSSTMSPGLQIDAKSVETK